MDANKHTFNDPSPFGTNHEHTRVERIKDYVYKNLSADLHAAAVSERFGISPISLQYLFLKHLKTSFRLYVEVNRMRCAYNLILNQGMLIKEAMYLTGYKNKSTFQRAFKRHFKISPSDLTR